MEVNHTMKVICIRNVPDTLDSFEQQLINRLTPGKIYQVNETQYFRYIVDDTGHVISYNIKRKDYLIPLEEWREQQLNKLEI